MKYSYGATQNITAVNTAATSGSWTNRPYTYADTAHPGALSGVSPSVAAATGSDTFAYDAAGRMSTRAINGTSTTNGWDPANQLTSTNVTAGVGAGTGYRYAYDADGQRTLKITTTGVTAYLGATEVTGTGTNLATLGGTRHYSLAGTTVATRTGSGTPSYLFNDVQGSASLSVTSGAPATATVKRQRYTPYGAARGTTNQLPIERGWLGQIEDDATGLTYLNARYYDPATARFISPDPLLDPNDPATHNPYTYALNNPETLSDPTGLDPDNQGPCGRECDPSSPTHSGNGGGRGTHTSKPAPATKPQESRPSTARNIIGGVGNALWGTGPGFIGFLAGLVPGGDPAEQYIEERRQYLEDAWGSDTDSAAYRWSEGTVTVVTVAASLSGAIRGGVRLLSRLSRARAARTAVSELPDLTVGRAQLEAKFKHAADFGVTESRGAAGFSAYGKAIDAFVNDSSTVRVAGTYRRNSAVLNYNPTSRLVVVQSPDGAFVSGWQMSEAQLQNVITRGSLGGG